MKTRFIRLWLGILLLGLAAPVPAATHLVTTGLDDFQNPPLGSLRHALEVLAQPGDTVKFASPIVVTQVDKFVIKAALTGLRLEGPGQITFKRTRTFSRGVLSVEANGVTLSGVAFKGVYVTAVGFDGGASVANLVVQGCKFTTRGSIALLFANGARIEDNEFFLTGNLRDEAAISIGASDDVLVANNTIESRGTNGIDMEDGKNFEARDNVTNAPVIISLRSGRVTGNTVTRRSMAVYQEHQEGRIVVENNECSALRVTGVDLSVRSNIVSGTLLLQSKAGLPQNEVVDEEATPQTALGVYVGLLNGQAAYNGPVIVEGNEVTGGKTGLAISQRIATPETSIVNNVVRRASLKGISLNITVAARVAGNTIEACTGKGRGPRAALAVHEGTEDLLIELNTLTGNRCNGVVISEGATATVKGNTITGGTRPGIVIAGGANIVAENNTVEKCKTGGIFLDPSSEATLMGNTIKNTAGPGIVVSTDADLTATNVTVEENTGPGILFKKLSRGVVTGATIRANRGAGISIVGGATARFVAGSFSANRGPGIDIAPAGISANRQRKSANDDIDFPEGLEFDAATRLIRGIAEPGALVQLYKCEPGAATGPRKNGEGVLFVGQGTVDGNGMFAIAPGSSQEGDLFCLTATRTAGNPVTSEFSENIEIPATAPIERVNVSSNEEEANNFSAVESGVLPNLSDNGRFVVFSSTATNLVNNDSNGGLDVFVRDLAQGTTARVSVTTSGEEATALGVPPSSSNATISADGRFVAFASTATNLVPGENHSTGYVALRDLELGTTTSVTDLTYVDNTRPVQSRRRANGTDPAISPDGSVVAFVSSDGAFVDEDTNTWPDLFVWIRATGAYERISVTTAGGQLPSGFNAALSTPRLSADGDRVAFVSSAALVPDNNTSGTKVFLRNRTAQTTELISLTSAGVAASGHSPSISRDGRYVAFVSASALLPEDTNGTSDVYIRDLGTPGVINLTLCSRTPAGQLFGGDASQPALSGNGRYLAFVGPGGSSDGGFIVLHKDLFVLDRQTGTVVEAGIGISGEAFADVLSPCLSNDGRFITFKSAATNLVDNDTNAVTDVFLRNRSAELEEP